MADQRKFALILLKYLEKIFPQDMATTQRTMNYVGKFDRNTILTLIDNGLIEEKEYSIKGLPKDMPDKAVVYKITSKGIEFLNGLKQKRTNNLLLILTLITTLIAISNLFVIF